MSQKTDPLNYLQDLQRNINKSVPDDPKLYVLKENSSF